MKAKSRCSWCVSDDAYVDYHDREWGVPVRDVGELFERLVLEGMQAGLSWRTVLAKRARMREQFFGFDVQRLAGAGERDVSGWLQDAGLIRHRGKLEAMIVNARLTLEQPDFSGWLWRFAPRDTRTFTSTGAVPATTAESVAMSKALRAAGYKFVGPTICYAFMQSVGMVNDHVTDCWRHRDCAELRAAVLAGLA